MEKDNVWLGVLNGLDLGLLDHLTEAGHRSPKVLEFESLRPPRSLIIGEQERAMVG